VLEIMLKYLEVADERKPRSVRVAHLAGKIAAAAKMNTFQVENIKSAALLIEAGDLRSNLHLYEEVAAFMERESKLSGTASDDRTSVLMRTTASLLKEAEPILANYFYHYVEEAKILDKDLSTVPMGSSIIALADLIDRLNTDMLPEPWKSEVKSLEDIRKLSGRAFPAAAVQALFHLASFSS
jgi:HD-GYP domain-containing protein (c-di-GMP phosphodiesterase class II)